MPQQSHKNKPPVGVFLATSIVMFFLTFSAADSIDFVPCQIDGSCVASQADVVASGADASATDSVALSSLPQLGIDAASAAVTTTPAPKGVTPTHLKISSVGVDLPIQNPSTRNVDALDALLKNGPARYVDSAELGVPGNMLIFAHSSHLPIVHNKMFQAFNQIPNVKKGDSVEVDGADGKTYLYSVDSVVKADTSDGTTISLATTDGTKLTLITCDTLTGVSARFILTATFVGVVDKSSQ